MNSGWFDFALAAEILPILAAATGLTVCMALAAFILAMLLGLPLCLLRRAKVPAVARATGFFIEFIRSTPLLVQVYFIYFALPNVGIVLSPLTTGILAMTLHYGCYLSEVYRSGLDAVPSGQWDVSTALGFPRFAFYRWIILPQVVPRIIAPAGGFIVYMIKETPLLSAIGTVELMYVAKDIGQERFQYLEPITIVGVIFLITSLVAAVAVRSIEAAYGRAWLGKERFNG
ncbi:amino acid ABC transporter membrane protein 2 (PAAT family) [Bradyrhizobium macuxiense]|uniref:Amino acid ABC transporter membrane protein 2 (PAAT family) n=1 Tax=Bradyrhizobium macuxiense TaxID=1755647 RepID=A0A560KS53_9BRAD|nr:ectoine/hydroxyectoine ABC transporter permease subunit EhuD [Bradyrhizobium macuxiense]TWB86017.1 amino acid ABC transporter membrane protein 2 (PAAT family) [Bradyrhizobium macuxiense]